MTVVIPVLLLKIAGFYVLGLIWFFAYEYIATAVLYVLASIGEFFDDVAQEIKSVNGPAFVLALLLYPVFMVIIFIGRVIDVGRTILSFIRRVTRRKTPEQSIPN